MMFACGGLSGVPDSGAGSKVPLLNRQPPSGFFNKRRVIRREQRTAQLLADAG
jgi:hypothetical protein